jgi:hypothetical protein
LQFWFISSKYWVDPVPVFLPTDPNILIAIEQRIIIIRVARVLATSLTTSWKASYSQK